MRIAVALLLIGCAVPARAADWVRVETPNFIVYSEAGEKRAREVAVNFERFREALGRVLSAKAVQAAVPTVVVVFGTQSSFRPYSPRFKGKPVELSGYFVSSQDKNVVMLTMEDREEAMRVTFHEYAHLVIANVASGLPLWLNEGLAEYYSTFEVENDGRGALIGRVIPRHVELLSTNTLLKMDQLLAVGHDSPLYNEGQRRSVFYAQSWAVVHILVLGEPSRASDLMKYVDATVGGRPSVEAWQDVFGPLDVTSSIRNYVNRRLMRATRYTFTTQLTADAGEAEKVSPAEYRAVLADLLTQAERTDEGAGALEQVIAAGGSAPRAKALLGLVRLQQGKADDARRLLLDAAPDPTDWLAQYYAAAGLVRMIASAGTLVDEGAAAAAERALDAVLTHRPDLPNALALRAMIRQTSGAKIEAGLRDIGKARAAAPGREDYVFIEAALNARRGSYAEARRLLGPMMTALHRPEVREQARQLMASIAEYELSMTRRAGEAPSNGTASSGAPSDVAASKDAGNAPQPRGGHFVPIFRKPGAGEQQSTGMLERIECSRNLVVLHVTVDGRTARFTAARLEDIEFITYRDDLNGAISCAVRTPADRVLVTWRPVEASAATGTSDGTVVAVEFPPIDR